MPEALVHLPTDAAPELLFLLLHGGGQRPEAMGPLAVALAAEYPQAAVLCLQAPLRADPDDDDEHAPDGVVAPGLQFYPAEGLTETNLAPRVATALPAFIATVRALQTRFAMSWERTALAGFSQGAIVALEAVQCEPRLAGRVLSFGGRHATPPDHAPVDTTLHILHGLEDPIEPHACIVDSARRLIVLGADVTADVLPGIGHELHPKLIDQALQQLRTFLPRRLWREAMSEVPIVARPASSRELG